MAWSRVQVFWRDERCVPAEHADSNYRLADELLLRDIPIPASNVHRIRTELGPQQAADYERTLRTFFSEQLEEGVSPSNRRVGRFDLIILGMGDDGHTASLFPGAAALAERRRLVVAHYVQQVNGWRITVTPVAINAAAQILFLVAGTSKAERLRDVLARPYQPDALPAQIISPSDGCLLWMVDEAAAQRLEGAK